MKLGTQFRGYGANNQSTQFPTWIWILVPEFETSYPSTQFYTWVRSVCTTRHSILYRGIELTTRVHNFLHTCVWSLLPGYTISYLGLKLTTRLQKVVVRNRPQLADANHKYHIIEIEMATFSASASRFGKPILLLGQL
jgi:hypothetical protein